MHESPIWIIMASAEGQVITWANPLSLLLANYSCYQFSPPPPSSHWQKKCLLKLYAQNVGCLRPLLTPSHLITHVTMQTSLSRYQMPLFFVSRAYYHLVGFVEQVNQKLSSVLKAQNARFLSMRAKKWCHQIQSAE